MADLSGVTKHFSTPSEGYSSTLSSSIVASASVVPVVSASQYQDGDVVTLIVDPKTSDEAVFTGTKASSPDRFIDCVWTEGNTGVGHASGAVIADYVTATHLAAMTKGLLVSHNQDGTLKPEAVETTFPSGNGTLNFAGGSPTGTVRYVVVGGICTVTIAITINSAITNNYNAITGMPPQHSSIDTSNVNNGWSVSYRDASANTLGTVTLGIARPTSIPGTFRFATVSGSEMTAGVPFVWAAGDTITGSFSYPVA